MNKNLSKIIITAALVSLALPGVASASWWNIFSWSWFKKSIPIQPAQVISVMEMPTETPEVTTAADSKPTEPTKETPQPLKPSVEQETVTSVPCDQECLERRAINKRNEEEARRLDAVMMENYRNANPIKPTSNEPPLKVSCAPEFPVYDNGYNVTWVAGASGGKEPYKYSWFGRSIYGDTGQKISIFYPPRSFERTMDATVTVTSFDGQSVKAGCMVTIRAGRDPWKPVID